MSDKEIGENIAFLRTSRKPPISQTELAERMDWTQSQVSAVEKGRRSVKLEEAAQIAQILEVDIYTLLTTNKVTSIIRRCENQLQEVSHEGRKLTAQIQTFLDTQSRTLRTLSEVAEKELPTLTCEERNNLAPYMYRLSEYAHTTTINFSLADAVSRFKKNQTLNQNEAKNEVSNPELQQMVEQVTGVFIDSEQSEFDWQGQAEFWNRIITDLEELDNV